MSHDRIARRVAAKFAAVVDGKLKELLLKVRKGATSSFTWKNLSDILTAMGGTVEKVTGAVSISDGFNGDYYAHSDRTRVEERHKEYQGLLVSSIPAMPKAGQLYITSLSDITPRHTEFEFKFTGSMGCEGWRVTLENASETFLPRGSDLGTAFHGFKTRPATKLPLWDVFPWLSKSTTWKAKADALLELPAFEPAVPRTRANTGTCGVCFQNIKIKSSGSMPTLVLHGYQRPGTGETHGRCFGVGQGPFELSVEATKGWRTEMVKHIKALEGELHRLKSGEVKSFPYTEHITITPDDFRWKDMLAGAIRKREKQIEAINDEMLVFERLIIHWKIRPLPVEGERLINWYLLGQKS